MTTTTREISSSYGDPDDFWAPSTATYLVEGDLAEKVLARVGQETGRVTIEQTKIPSGYSSYTWWNEIEFTIYVDGGEVWSTPEQSESPWGFDWKDTSEENMFGESNYALFNQWLEEVD